MWAQGLTIGVLIAAGALTHSKRAKALEHVRLHVGPMIHILISHAYSPTLIIRGEMS